MITSKPPVPRPLCKHAEPVEGCPACRLWATSNRYREACARLQSAPPPERVAEEQRPRRPPGPGTKFKELTDTLGLAEWEGCSCTAIRRDMDDAGVAGCRLRRDEFRRRIGANVADGIARKKISKWAWVRAAYRAVRTGLATKIDPRDPVAGLFDLAVDTAEREGNENVGPENA